MGLISAGLGNGSDMCPEGRLLKMKLRFSCVGALFLSLPPPPTIVTWLEKPRFPRRAQVLVKRGSAQMHVAQLWKGEEPELGGKSS